jgi:acyl-CoA reductase-like NAD-dependent aldehyde dehydrogenase
MVNVGPCSPFFFLILTSCLLTVSQCGAIAAGNAVVLKPAESTPALSSLLAELVPKYLDPSFVRVVNGSIPEVTKVSFLTSVQVSLANILSI